MWLTARRPPGLRTINDFRGKRLKGRINELFSKVVSLMQEEGFVSRSTQYIDGSKPEDATFMRMKEDQMKNGQLKPADNVQILLFGWPLFLCFRIPEKIVLPDKAHSNLQSIPINIS